MNEDHEVLISSLMDDLLARLKFDIEKQPPAHLPHITQAVVHLNAFRTGMIKGDEKHIMEVTLLKNINQQIKGYGRGEDHGSNENRQPNI